MSKLLNASLFTVTIVGGAIGVPPRQSVTFLTRPRVRSVNVLRIEIPAMPPGGSVSVDVRAENEDEFRAAHVLGTIDPGIGASRFEAVSGETAVLVVPIAGSLTRPGEGTLFATPGTYTIRVTRNMPAPRSPTDKPPVLTSDIEFSETPEADVRLLEHVQTQTRAALMHALGFDRLPEAYTKQFTPMDILGYVVLQTVEDPSRGTREQADLFNELASGFPKSSYGPYLAYYAGSVYLRDIDSVTLAAEHGVKVPDERVRTFPEYTKGVQALELAVKHGDPFIKPLAMGIDHVRSSENQKRRNRYHLSG